MSAEYEVVRAERVSMGRRYGWCWEIGELRVSRHVLGVSQRVLTQGVCTNWRKRGVAP